MDQEKLSSLMDRMEIEEVMKLYFAATDRQRVARIDLWDNVFTPTGKLWIYGQLVRGPGLTFTHEEPLGATHALHQSLIEIEGDTAKSETYAFVHRLLPGDPLKMEVRGLRYLDKWVRMPVGWRIEERWHNLDWTYEVESTSAITIDKRMTYKDL